MPLFSVLIPAYNAEKYIGECLDSILTQEEIEGVAISEILEVIIADDGSTDKTAEICRAYAEGNPQIKVFSKENEGLLITRDFLIGKATGEYILSMDSDDRWQPNLIKTVYRKLKEYNYPDMLHFGLNTWKGAGVEPFFTGSDKDIYCKMNEEDTAWYLILSVSKYNSVCLKAVKREIFLKGQVAAELKKIRRGEDRLRTIACAELCDTFLAIPDYLYDYREDNESMTRSFAPDYFDECLTVEKLAFSKIGEHTSEKEEHYIKWAEAFIVLFNRYIADAFMSKYSYSEAVGFIEKYRGEELIQKALRLSRRTKDMKSKTRAFLISTGMYRVLRFLYR